MLCACNCLGTTQVQGVKPAGFQPCVRGTCIAEKQSAQQQDQLGRDPQVCDLGLRRKRYMSASCEAHDLLKIPCFTSGAEGTSKGTRERHGLGAWHTATYPGRCHEVI